MPRSPFLDAIDETLGDRVPAPSIDHHVAELASVGGLSVRRRDILHSYEPVNPAAIVVLEGRKSLYSAHRLTRHDAGALMVFSAGQPLTVINEPDPRTGRYRTVWLEFRPRLLERFAAAYPEPVRDAAAAGMPRGVHYLEIPAGPAVADAYLHALKAVAGKPAVAPVLTEHRLMELLLALAGGPALPVVFAPRLGDVATRVRTMVRMEPGAAWTAEAVARRLAVSVPTLNRRLREQGLTLRRIIEDERMMLAAALLHEGDLSVGGVAERCGYASPSRFAHRFKTRFGLAPSEAARGVIVSA